MARCIAEGRRVRRTAKDSLEKRTRTKLLGKSMWFKKRKGQKEDWYGKDGKKAGRGLRTEMPKPKATTTPKSVLFVEKTPGGSKQQSLRTCLYDWRGQL